MYSLPSTSQTRAPWALLTKKGSPPTARNARTGELTPPGMYFNASLNSEAELSNLRFTWRTLAGEFVGKRPIEIFGFWIAHQCNSTQRESLAYGDSFSEAKAAPSGGVPNAAPSSVGAACGCERVL